VGQFVKELSACRLSYAVSKDCLHYKMWLCLSGIVLTEWEDRRPVTS